MPYKDPQKRNEASRRYQADNKDKCRVASRLRYQKNKDKIRLRHKKWINDNKDYHKELMREYYCNNKDSYTKRTYKWRKENPDKVRASKAKVRASKLDRMPKWLSRIQLIEIKCIYLKCVKITKQTGILHHVDHIIPLHGKNVSGLHVPWNLQILTAKDNQSKSNKL